MASYIHEVWYTKPNGECMMAWQGLTYQQALLKVREMTALGYDVCIKTPPSAPRTAASPVSRTITRGGPAPPD